MKTLRQLLGLCEKKCTCGEPNLNHILSERNMIIHRFDGHPCYVNPTEGSECLEKQQWSEKGAIISGHDYQEVKSSVADSQWLECKKCGHISVGKVITTRP